MKKILYLLLSMVLILFFIAAIYIYKGYDMYKNALKETTISEKVNSIKSKENYTTIDNLPKTYKNAVISAEDHRFYRHNGIDIISIGRAIVHDIKNKNLNEGGSTITQQLAKNIYFTQEKKLTRKIAEIFMAFKLEEEIDKDEILELYLNTSYFGNGHYNVYDASYGYFGKAPIDMTDYESTLLAGLPNAPSVYGSNKQLASERQKQILVLMVEYKYLSTEEKEAIELEIEQNLSES